MKPKPVGVIVEVDGGGLTRPPVVVWLCNQAECRGTATSRMYWPGRAASMVCAVHAARAREISEAMGFELVIEPLDSP